MPPESIGRAELVTRPSVPVAMTFNVVVAVSIVVLAVLASWRLARGRWLRSGPPNPGMERPDDD